MEEEKRQQETREPTKTKRRWFLFFLALQIIAVAMVFYTALSGQAQETVWSWVGVSSCFGLIARWIMSSKLDYFLIGIAAVAAMFILL
jgi:hypothetical protein